MSPEKKMLPSLERVTTIGEMGKRFWVYPASFHGLWLKRRQVVAYVLILVYFLLPWTKVGGHQTILLNVAERKFAFFGLTFWPQDFAILWFFVVGSAILIFFVTAEWGRLWCGWACPQTVFLEHVFRRVENWIEGSARQRKKLDQGPWTWEKIRKKGLKFTLFVLISSHFANTALCYFVGSEKVVAMTLQSPGENWSWFLFMGLANLLFFLDFAWFREQFCIIVCPYGRFQSVLLDKESMIVGYDPNRGEPRAPIRKKQIRTAGDCIDCKRCVNVCPTGIDIRMGLQMECINCTACMDACDDMMDRVDLPRGLIRYTSIAELEGRRRKFLRFRTAAYGFLIVLLFGVGSFLMARRSDLILRLIRPNGSSFTLVEDGQMVTNLFHAKASNKSDHEIVLIPQVPPGYEMVAAFSPWVVPAQGFSENQVFIRKAAAEFSATGKEEMSMVFIDQDEKPHAWPLTLIGPVR